MKIKKSNGVRHGEVILIPTDKLLAKAKRMKQFILAHSETGHHHVIESEVPFTVDEKNMYIELLAPAKLVHKKTFDFHKTLPLKKGIYERYEAIEYDPFAQITRKVID